MYSETNRQPWSASIVILAVLIFGGVLLWNLRPKENLPPPLPTATTTPPIGSVEISIYSSDTKEKWLDDSVASFNAAHIKVKSGNSVFVRAYHVNSGGSQTDILSGKIQPTIWSPGEMSWVNGLNIKWNDRVGRPLFPSSCAPTVYAPVGFAMWRPMAEALGWPDKPISWETIATLAADPQGWGSYGHPEWGLFKLGHTHPDHSNSGLLLLAALAYDKNNLTEGLTPPLVKQASVVEAFRQVELHTYHYGVRSKDLLALMIKRGPAYLHAINTTETDVIRTNQESAKDLTFPLAFIFPAKGTFWAEHPFCIAQGEWVNDEQHEAAELFEKFLRSPEQQKLAATYYLRPVDESVAVQDIFTLEKGTDPRVTPKTVPALATLSGEAEGAVKDVFHQVKKKATVILVLDTSGSMQGDKMKSAIASTIGFIKKLERDDEAIVIAFNDAPIELSPSGRIGDVGELLAQKVGGLYPQGNTALYDAVCQAVQKVDSLQIEDRAASDPRLYGVVVLSDGDDTASKLSENAMFACLPSGEDVEGVKVFTIAYGGDADLDVLKRIANRTNGKAFEGDPATIEKVYIAISAEQ